MQEEATDLCNSSDPEISRILFEEGKTHNVYAMKYCILHYIKTAPLILVYCGYVTVLSS